MTDQSQPNPHPIRSFTPRFSRVDENSKKLFDEWAKQFPIVDLEVGCGNGFHPIQRAQLEPKRGLIAVERTREKGNGLRVRLQNHPKIQNIFPFYGEASEILPFVLGAQKIAKLFLLYPNPYPKESQKNKRWHYSSFFHFLLKSLQPEGLIELRTNEPWLAQESSKYFTELWNLSLVQDNKITGPQEVYRTHFEKKYLLRGQTCFQLVFQKSQP